MSRKTDRCWYQAKVLTTFKSDKWTRKRPYEKCLLSENTYLSTASFKGNHEESDHQGN